MMLVLLLIMKALMFREHDDPSRAHAREVIQDYPVHHWYRQPQNLTMGLMAAYTHRAVGGDAHTFSLFALFIDLTIFTSGFVVLFTHVYKKLGPEMRLVAMTLGLICPAMSITQYDQGGELIFTYACTVWNLYFISIESTYCVAGLLGASYYFAPDTLFYYNVPIAFTAIGQLIIRHMGEM